MTEQMTDGMAQRPVVDPGRGVYGISVAAELAGIGTQTLRVYEARGQARGIRRGVRPGEHPRDADRRLSDARFVSRTSGAS